VLKRDVSKLLRKLMESKPGQPERQETSDKLVAAVRSICENLLELAGSNQADLGHLALNALADIQLCIHQTSLVARHLSYPDANEADYASSALKNPEMFGEVVVDRGLASIESVLRALNLQRRESYGGTQPRLIGEILVAEGVIDAEQVETVLMNIRGKMLRGIENQLAAAKSSEA